jgi:hypothetical protein
MTSSKNQDLQNESKNETFEVDEKITTSFNDSRYKEVSYNAGLKLSRASIMQLLYFYTHRLEKQKADVGNKWQESAYPELVKLFQDLKKGIVDAVVDLCNSCDKDVVMINYCGYEGFKLPLMVQTKGVHFRTTYLYANVKHILKTIEQRLSYLAVAPVPLRYQADEKKQEAFRKVQDLAKVFLSTHIKTAFVRWQEICQKAAEVAGLKPDFNRTSNNDKLFNDDYRSKNLYNLNKFNKYGKSHYKLNSRGGHYGNESRRGGGNGRGRGGRGHGRGHDGYGRGGRFANFNEGGRSEYPSRFHKSNQNSDNNTHFDLQGNSNRLDDQEHCYSDNRIASNASNRRSFENQLRNDDEHNKNQRSKTRPKPRTK